MSKTITKSTVNKISFFVGVLAIIAAGLVFVVMTDLRLRLGSAWMLVAILLSFGSGVCTILSDNFKERVKLMYILKGVAILLTVLFVGFLFIYMSTAFKGTEKGMLFSIAKYTKKVDKLNCLTVVIATAIMGALSFVGQVLNVVLTATIKDE